MAWVWSIVAIAVFLFSENNKTNLLRIPPSLSEYVGSNAFLSITVRIFLISFVVAVLVLIHVMKQCTLTFQFIVYC